MLTDFHEAYSAIIKMYISKKNDLHNDRESYLFTENSMQQFKSCKFKSIEELNKTLNILIGRMSTKLEVDEASEEKMVQKTQHYLEDLNYEVTFIGQELRGMEMRLKELLVVKESSPVVLGMDPAFNNPKFY